MNPKNERGAARASAREAAFKFLYAYCLTGNADQTLREDLRAEAAGADVGYFDKITGGALGSADSLSEIIKGAVEGYALDRVYKIDLAVLMLAAYELTACSDTPAPVVINEAVELAKIYSTEKSPSFVNGILARLLPVLRPE